MGEKGALTPVPQFPRCELCGWAGGRRGWGGHWRGMGWVELGGWRWRMDGRVEGGMWEGLRMACMSTARRLVRFAGVWSTAQTNSPRACPPSSPVRPSFICLYRRPSQPHAYRAAPQLGNALAQRSSPPRARANHSARTSATPKPPDSWKTSASTRSNTVSP